MAMNDHVGTSYTNADSANFGVLSATGKGKSADIDEIRNINKIAELRAKADQEYADEHTRIQEAADREIYNAKLDLLNKSHEAELKNIQSEADLKSKLIKEGYKISSDLLESDENAKRAQAREEELSKFKADQQTKLNKLQDEARNAQTVKDRLATNAKYALEILKSKTAAAAKDIQTAKEDKAYKNTLKERVKQAKESNNKEAKEKAEADLKEYKNYLTAQKKLKNSVVEENKQQAQNDFLNDGGVFSKNATIKERASSLKNAFTDESGELDLSKGFSELTNALSSVAQQLNTQIDKIAGRQSDIDTRLYGSGYKWTDISSDILGNVALSPYVKQEDVADAVQKMVDEGIAYNVEQRAFLSVISSKIATTFDANDSTLRKLIRIQQEDTTAYRLGMEASMNAFLNNMYETTEYLQSVASNVRSSLYEMEALSDSTTSLEVEYQVQKWMGSLYSSGMSEGATESIASAFGKVAAGDVTGITSGGTGNLIVMAANQAGLSIADILANGLDASETNTLLNAAVQYLADLYEESSDSRVVQQQIANVFGLSASDLKAAVNAANTNGGLSTISGTNLNVGGMYSTLNNMANSIYTRTSLGEMSSNVYENFMYSMASGVASSPTLYAIYKIGSLLKDTTGGINIPAISVVGNAIDLETTVADLLMAGSLSTGILSGIGKSMFNGSGGGFSGSGMIQAFGKMKKNNVVLTSSSDTSESGYVGNESASDIQTKTVTEANESGQEQLVEAQEDENADVSNKVLNESIVNIYNLLLDVTSGTQVLTVKVQDYGLTWGDSALRTAAVNL